MNVEVASPQWALGGDSMHWESRRLEVCWTCTSVLPVLPRMTEGSEAWFPHLEKGE